MHLKENSHDSFFRNLFNAGVSNIDSIEAKRIIITNYTICLALFCCCVYLPILFFFKVYPLNFVFLFFALYYVGMWRLNHIGKSVFSKLGVYAGLLIQVNLMSYSLTDQVNVKTFYIPIAIVPFIIFGPNERKYLYGSLAASLINILLINSFNSTIGGLQFNFTRDDQQWIFISFDIACIACMIILAFLFLSLTEFGENLLMVRNKELEESKKEQQRLNELKDKLYSIISHDFKSPLNNIQSVTDLLLDDALSKEQVAIVMKGMGQSVRNTSQLLDNLLNWSAGQLNNATPVLELVSVKDVVSKIIHHLEYRSKPKKISILENIDLSHKIMADQYMLEIILRNLIINAIKFSNPGQQIEISSKINGSQFLLSVTDNGIGIPTQIFDKLFLPDYSKSRYGTANEKGYGIGLLLCKDLAELHKGKIIAESVPGHKTTFTVSLPIKVAESKMN